MTSIPADSVPQPAVPSLLWRLWLLASSPVTFVVLSLFWCLDLGLGSIYAYRLDPQFWVKMDAYPFNVWLREVAPRVFPESWWVYGLVWLTYLVILSLLVCTLNWLFIRRKRARGVGEVLVHLGFLLVFAGFVLGSGFGQRTQGVQVAEGQTVPVADTGLELRLLGVEMLLGPGGRPMDTVSRVELLRGGEPLATGSVRTNHPLIAGSTVVYPQGAQSHITGATLAVAGAGVAALSLGEELSLADGRRVQLRAILHPGERRGPYFGPGFLVGLAGRDGTRQGTTFLSPATRDVVELGGVRLRLVDLEVSPVGVYNVHRDPGVSLVLAGALILTVGTFWALAGYLRARPALPVTDA